MQKTVCADVFKHEMTEKYFNTVYRLALNQMKNKELAEDVTQDVFLKYINIDKDFESEEHVKAWLIRVTVNTCKNIFNAAWFKKSAPLEEDIAYEEKDDMSDVYSAVMELPKKYKAVIHLFYYEDMSIASIASCLNEKESTIKSQLHRAREILKKTLKGGCDLEF